MTFKRTDFSSLIALNSYLLEATTNRDRYDEFLSSIYRLWKETISSINMGCLDEKKLDKLVEFQNEWDKYVQSIKEIDLAIRVEVNSILIFASEKTNRNLLESDLTQLVTYKIDHTNSYEIVSHFSGKISASFQNSTFKLLRLCVVLSNRIMEIMSFLQKVRNVFCADEIKDSILENNIRNNSTLDADFIRESFESLKQRVEDLSGKIDRRNTIDTYKPLSQSRCASLIVDALEKEFPNVKQKSIKRMLSDWDNGKREAVRDYFYFKKLGNESLFSSWAAVIFRVYYRNEKRGKYVRKKTSHDEHDLDQYALSQYEQTK